MRTFKRVIISALLFCFITSVQIFSQNAIDGKWKILNYKSSFLDYYTEMTLDIASGKKDVTITTKMGPKRKFSETIKVTTDGKANKLEIIDGTYFTNIHMGLRLPLGKNKEVTAKWEKDNLLVVTEKYDMFASQGVKKQDVTYLYELSTNKDLLTLTIKRSSRKKGDLKLVFKRAEDNNAYEIRLTDDWHIDSKLPEHACIISVQGIVNEKKPLLYLNFGPEYPFNCTEDIYNFLEKQKHFSFTKLRNLEQVLETFKDHIKGYIVWDKKERTSLIVAYTLAGLEKGIVITEDMILLAQKMGFKQIEDYRGKFTGKSDYEIYSWAKEKYWSRCSRDLIVWIGGVHHPYMMPACADYGMINKGFCSDLSARATDTLEYNLTRSLFAEMTPLSQVWGWHSYKKDREEEMTTLLSSYALVSDGLNTHPNTSFLVHVPVTPGFKFKNNHQAEPGKKYIPEKKIYVSLIQTDGLGIGAWLKPGRGSIPYAWEVSMKFLHMSPAMISLSALSPDHPTCIRRHFLKNGL